MFIGFFSRQFYVVTLFLVGTIAELKIFRISVQNSCRNNHDSFEVINMIIPKRAQKILKMYF